MRVESIQSFFYSLFQSALAFLFLYITYIPIRNILVIFDIFKC